MSTRLRWVVLAFGMAFTFTAAQAATPLGPPRSGNPNQAWGTRRPVTAQDRARIAHYRSAASPIEGTSFSSSADLQANWLLQSDDRSNLKSCRRPGNVAIVDAELQLRTLDATDCKAQWSTASLWSRTKRKFGFFEASIRAADVPGINNAFWLVTDDRFEIDIAEIHYPNIVRLTLHDNNDWDTIKDDRLHAVGFESKFAENLSQGYHDYGVLWTPNDIVYEIDGDPIAAITTNGAINAPADIRLSTAVTDYAGTITDPVGHAMHVRSVKVVQE